MALLGALSSLFYPLLLFGGLSLLILFGVKRSKYSKFKTVSIFFLVIGCIILVVAGISISTNNYYKNSDAGVGGGDGGFTIEDYDIDLDVSEKNTIKVKESINVNFTEAGHHGIYKFIPVWLQYTNKDGETESRKAKISSLRAVGEDYSNDTVNGKSRIRIGSASVTLPTGEHHYNIEYIYDLGGDPYDGYDEFIFHAFGDYWSTPINNPSVTVHFPKDVSDIKDIHFYADKKRNKEITDEFDFYTSKDTLYIKAKPGFKLEKSLTISVVLPEGFFKSAESNYSFVSLSLCVTVIIMAVISFFVWLLHGKDFDKGVETVEFYPPDGLDVSDIGYIYSKDSGKKLAIATMVKLASRGFIKILENDEKTEYTIVNNYAVDVDAAIKREIVVQKLKDYNPKTLDFHSEREEFMKKHFPDGTKETKITSDFDQFFRDTKYLVDYGFIKIVSDSKDEYSAEALEKIKKTISAESTHAEDQLTEYEKIVYDKLFEDGESVILKEHKTFYKAISDVGAAVRLKQDDIINDVKSYFYMLLTSMSFALGSLFWMLAYCFIKDLNPKLKIFYTLGIISVVLIFFFAMVMRRKTQYGEDLMARIKGFRNYLETAEKQQLELLVEKNPNYFFDILPYAYVLGVSKKWISRFENIPLPEHDMGNFDYRDIDRIDSLSDSVYYPTSSSGGGGGCGGGCSSCGGGCSSCGGGGSW